MHALGGGGGGDHQQWHRSGRAYGSRCPTYTYRGRWPSFTRNVYLPPSVRAQPAHVKRLAARVRQLREKRGLNQDDLEDWGLHWKTVQAIEYARGDVKLATLIKLAKAFGITVAELLRGVVPGR